MPASRSLSSSENGPGTPGGGGRLAQLCADGLEHHVQPRVVRTRPPDGEHDAPARPEHAADLARGPRRIGHEHQALAAEHRVERRVRFVDLREIEVARDERIGRIFQVIRAAAGEDADSAALFARLQTEYRANQHAVVESLRRKRALARGLGVERGADILWTINHPDVWQLLVVERGWSPEEYERWCADTACAQLLQSGSTGSPTRTRPGSSTSK